MYSRPYLVEVGQVQVRDDPVRILIGGNIVHRRFDMGFVAWRQYLAASYFPDARFDVS